MCYEIVNETLAYANFFSRHSRFFSSIRKVGFMALTEWIGILSSDIFGCGHGHPVDLLYFLLQGIGICMDCKLRGRIPPSGASFVYMLSGNLKINPYCECPETLLPFLQLIPVSTRSDTVLQSWRDFITHIITQLTKDY